jgi:hypothetical protein
VRRQHLDGDSSVEPSIPCLVHFPHATGAEKADDLVGAETCTGIERHVAGEDYIFRERACISSRWHSWHI